MFPSDHRDLRAKTEIVPKYGQQYGGFRRAAMEAVLLQTMQRNNSFFCNKTTPLDRSMNSKRKTPYSGPSCFKRPDIRISLPVQKAIEIPPKYPTYKTISPGQSKLSTTHLENTLILGDSLDVYDGESEDDEDSCGYDEVPTDCDLVHLPKCTENDHIEDGVDLDKKGLLEFDESEKF